VATIATKLKFKNLQNCFILAMVTIAIKLKRLAKMFYFSGSYNCNKTEIKPLLNAGEDVSHKQGSS